MGGRVVNSYLNIIEYMQCFFVFSSTIEYIHVRCISNRVNGDEIIAGDGDEIVAGDGDEIIAGDGDEIVAGDANDNSGNNIYVNSFSIKIYHCFGY